MVVIVTMIVIVIMIVMTMKVTGDSGDGSSVMSDGDGHFTTTSIFARAHSRHARSKESFKIIAKSHIISRNPQIQ
jgi:hypothetical protein